MESEGGLFTASATSTPTHRRLGRNSLCFSVWRIPLGGIRGGFLTEVDRGKLVALVRDGSAASRVTRRANALVLLDGGWSCQEVAAALLMDDDTIRGWHKL
jgi:hypothetical protein